MKSGGWYALHSERSFSECFGRIFHFSPSDFFPLTSKFRWFTDKSGTSAVLRDRSAETIGGFTLLSYWKNGIGKRHRNSHKQKHRYLLDVPAPFLSGSIFSSLQLSKDPATDNVTSVCSPGSSDILSLQHSQDSAERERLFWALSVDLFNSLLSVRISNGLNTFSCLTCA